MTKESMFKWALGAYIGSCIFMAIGIGYVASHFLLKVW